jgi:hypothetical protein
MFPFDSYLCSITVVAGSSKLTRTSGVCSWRRVTLIAGLIFRYSHHSLGYGITYVYPVPDIVLRPFIQALRKEVGVLAILL